MTPPTAGLVQSLLIKGQRAQLDEIGRMVGTPVLYLKAAWADPVLYGGRGERTGTDIDLLVRPARFEAFAAALTARGFRRFEHPSSSYERYFGWKESSFHPPPGAISVDLHRALTEPVWYELDSDEVIDRAHAWPSVDGPILSLDAEDQLLYAAAHYSNHLYDLDPRHFGDCQRLCAAQALDWELVWLRARKAKLSVPVALLVDALAASGVALPPAATAARSLPLRLRRRLAGWWVATQPALERRRPRSSLDHLTLRPLLSDKATALPRVVVSFGIPWAFERLRRLRRR